LVVLQAAITAVSTTAAMVNVDLSIRRTVMASS
jgi:hypothetical protein